VKKPRRVRRGFFCLWRCGFSLLVFPWGDIFRHVSLGNAAPTDYPRLRGLWDAPDCFRGIHGGKYLDGAVEQRRMPGIRTTGVSRFSFVVDPSETVRREAEPCKQQIIYGSAVSEGSTAKENRSGKEHERTTVSRLISESCGFSEINSATGLPVGKSPPGSPASFKTATVSAPSTRSSSAPQDHDAPARHPAVHRSG